MATKFDVLAALIEADHHRWGGDENGHHHVVANVVSLISQSHGSEEELADAIYDMIADSYAGRGIKADEDPVDQT